MAGSELTSEAPADQGLCSAQQKRRRTDGGGSRKVIPETPAGPSIGATSGLGDPARGAVSPRSPLSQCDCHRALAGRREEEQRNATSAPSGRNGGQGAA